MIMTDGARISGVETTVFFVRAATGGLRQLYRVTVENPGDTFEGTIVAHGSGRDIATPLGRISHGSSRHEVEVPDPEQGGPLQLRLRHASGWSDEQTITVKPQRHWECHLVHGSHHDMGYSDIPSNVLREHASSLDRVIELCEETVGWEEDSRFHFVVEQAWSALYHLENRPPRTAQRMLRLMREGRVEVTALFANETSELCAHEEQARLLYPAFRLARLHGVAIRTAELNDIPGASWGLVSVLAGAGVRYFAPGIQDYFGWGGRRVRPHWDEEQVLPRDALGAFWWEGADRSRVLFWYGGASIESLHLWTLEQAARDLPPLLGALAAREYPCPCVRLKLLSGRRDNSPPDIRFSEIARDWNRRWAYPRLILSTNARFFSRFESMAGNTLRTLRGELTGTDYPIGATSRARELGVNRRTHDVLSQAEKLAAWAAVEGHPYPAEALAEAYEAELVGDEHTGGMAHPAGPAQEACWSWKSERVWRGAALAHDVLVKSANVLADRLHIEARGYHVAVWNTLGHRRTDIVRLRAHPPEPASGPMHWQEPAAGTGEPRMLVHGRAAGRGLVNLPAELLENPFALVDVATGAPVPCQVVTLADYAAARPDAAEMWSLGHTDHVSAGAKSHGRAHLLELVFVATDVPPMGLRVYRIVPAAAWPAYPSVLHVGDHTLAGPFYRVEVNPETGALRSVVDAKTGREWVDREAPFGLNQLLARPAGSATARGAACSSIERGDIGPVLASLVVRGAAAGCPEIVQEITLYAGLGRIDLATRVLRDATPLLEHYVAFPLAIRSPSFRCETSGAVIRPVRDQLPGTNTDSYAVQHWVDVSDRAGGLAWASIDAPVVELAGLAPSSVSQAHHAVAPPGFGRPWLRDDAELRRGHLYSFVMDNNFRTNFQASQVGDMLFRYSLATHGPGWNDIDSAKFGWEAATPLETTCIQGPQAGVLEPGASFCRIDGAAALLLAVKAAEDGDGLVIRLAETAGRAGIATLALPRITVARATAATIVEEDREELAHDEHTVEVPLTPNGRATVRIRDGRQYAVTDRLTWLS